MNSGAWAGSVSAPAATASGDVLVAADAAELAPRRRHRDARASSTARAHELDVLLVGERGAVGHHRARARLEARPRSARGRRSGRAGRRPRACARPAAATSAASSRSPPGAASERPPIRRITPARAAAAERQDGRGRLEVVAGERAHRGALAARREQVCERHQHVPPRRRSGRDDVGQQLGAADVAGDDRVVRARRGAARARRRGRSARPRAPIWRRARRGRSRPR